MVLTREQFVKKYFSTAQKAVGKSGLFPQVLLSQAIVESSGLYKGNFYPGQSLLAKYYNNYFGIKVYPGYNGKRVTLQTGEFLNGKQINVSGTFCVFDSFQDSAKGYVNFLLQNKRYENVFLANTPSEQINEIAEAGYATAPTYASTLKNVLSHVVTWSNEALAALNNNKGKFAAVAAATLFFF